MCLNLQKVKNKYTGKELYVPCGDCPACQVERSRRQMVRLMNAPKGFFAIFFTLVYDNDYLPYVYVDDIGTDKSIPVHRRCRVHYQHIKGSKAEPIQIKTRKEHTIGMLETDYKSDYRRIDKTEKYPEPVGFDQKGVMAVSYSRDFTLFLKRFQIYFKRKYGITLSKSNGNFSFYRVSEYGPTTFRPHFHALFYFPEALRKNVAHFFYKARRAIIKAWPYCSPHLLLDRKKGVTLAVKPNAYVSKYTSRPTDTPSVLQATIFRPKSTYSRGFGFDNDGFTSSSVLDSIERGDLSYTYFRPSKARIYEPVTLRLPSYVQYKFFYPFKGIRGVDDITLFSVLANIKDSWPFFSSIGYSFDDYQKAKVYFYRRCFIFNMSTFQYAELYIRYRKLRRSLTMSYQYDYHTQAYPLSLYDNMFDSDNWCADLARSQGIHAINEVPERIAEYNMLFNEYHENMKQRRTSEYFQSRDSYEAAVKQRWHMFNFKSSHLCLTS